VASVDTERTVLLTYLQYFSFFSANFDRTEDDKVGMGLTRIDIGLDTGILLDSMVKEARMVVFNAVAKATSGSKPMIDPELMKGKKNGPSQLSSGFGSSLKLSPSQAKIASRGLKLPGVREGQHQPVHRTMKAHNSSLRLNKVLSTSTIQSSRSVQFGTLDLKAKAIDEVPKRQKLATTAKLTSFKSFGRPHAGDFDGDRPMNATFANFGGGGKKYWGRDGKLASKPRPMLPSETADMLTSQTRRNANATFDTQKPPIHLSGSSGLGISRKKSNQNWNARSPMPRTATAAEGWLLENMKGKF